MKNMKEVKWYSVYYSLSTFCKCFVLLVALLMVTSNTYSQNVCLDFDGNDDYVRTPLLLPDTDFTVEMWFLSADNSTNTACSGNFRKLFAFGGDRFEMGTCGGIMTIYWQDNCSNIFPPTSISTTNFNTDTWHHIAVVRTGLNIEIFIDCNSVWTGPMTCGFNFTTFNLGHWSGAATPGEDWLGQIDDVRVWNRAKLLPEITNQKNCVLNCNETNLQLYWTFDEGVNNANNTTITNVLDCSPNGNNGSFNPATSGGHALLPVASPSFGNMSNFANSATPLAYPNLNNLDIEIRDYPYQTALLTEICDGDPAHFSLSENGVVPGPFSNIPVQWYYRDGPSAPIALTSPPFSDFRFGVPQGNINYDCATSTDGFVDRTFYAVSSVTEPTSGAVCDYQSADYDLRICCPISSATVDISPPDPLCEGETITVNVCLNSPDLFVQTPGQYVDIEWYYNGNYIGFTDQTCFNYTLTAPLVTAPQSLCFEARVTNCNGKTGNFQSCLTVDPEPICGSIIGWPVPNPLNMTLVSSTPHLTYEICPGNDAQVSQDPTDLFIDCIPQWQYSYDCATWIDVGLSNIIQNTNIIPTTSWPGNEIFYRVQCNPLSSPSGCDPCFSNKIEIRLKAAPIPNSITGTGQLCKGDSNNVLTVTTIDPLHSYTWYCDGLQVATGTSFTHHADKSACYWIETSDSCSIVESPPFCVEVCEVVAQLSCPLTPNDCACLGDPITLSACDSYSTCAPSNLQYTWYIDGLIQTTTACTITDTPAATGTVYKVEVVDLTTGCMDMTETTVVPCDKDE